MAFCCGGASRETNKEVAADDSAIVEEVVCKAEDVPDGCKKEVELRGRKILVVNDGGKYSAVNGVCSHFNFPLVNGTYYKGKIRCPLHGACFSMKTGDIEDYPAFDALQTFLVRKVGDNLSIKTTEKRLEGNRRTRRSFLSSTTKANPIIVVGSGPAGQSIAENLRMAGCRSPIIMFTKEDVPPYDRVPLTKKMEGDLSRFRPDEYYLQEHIDIRLNSKVVAFDASAHTVTLADKSVYKYSKLVLALGGAVRNLINKGSSLKGIHTIRVHTDAKAVVEDAKYKHVVCIGAGFIGMEAASALVDLARTVTVICSSAEPLPAFGVDVGKAVREYFGTKGVSILTNARLDHFEGINGHVSQVVLKDGSRLAADCVVVGVGVNPDTDWLRHHKIDLDTRGRIKVNEHFETSVKDVLAIGDVVSAPLPYWGIDSICIEHFQVAQKHGLLAAWSIMGRPQPGKLIPFFWSLFFSEKGIRMAGCTEGYDEIFTRGNVEELNFVKYYLKKGKVIAVCNAGQRPTAIQFLALCDQGRRLTGEEVEKNTTDDWAFLLK